MNAGRQNYWVPLSIQNEKGVNDDDYFNVVHKLFLRNRPKWSHAIYKLFSRWMHARFRLCFLLLLSWWFGSKQSLRHTKWKQYHQFCPLKCCIVFVMDMWMWKNHWIITISTSSFPEFVRLVFFFFYYVCRTTSMPTK